ncbi:MAG: glycosyltransferase family 4 protein [Candidatus Hodarchaeota archaeon]
MDVLIIAQYFPPDIGGASTRAFNVAKGLMKMGCSVDVIAAFPHYPEGNIPDHYRGKSFIFEKKDDINISRVWLPPLAHNSILNRVVLHFCFLITSLFLIPFKRRFDVVWAANPNLFSFISALIYAFIRQKPIIRNVDDLWPEIFYEIGLVKSSIFKKLLNFLAWLSYFLPVAITPISNGYKHKIMEKYGVKGEKIRVIEVGVDTSLFKSNLNTEDEFIVMYSGILGPAYDFKNILMTAKILFDYKEIKFLIRGIGECEHDIRKMICNFSLDNVVLDTNVVSKLKLIEILNLADIFLLPMKKINAVDEGLPTKIFEYQAMGKPIICCSRGESARYIKSTQSGLVVNPEDPKSLALAIMNLYKNRELILKLGANGQKYVNKNLSIERIGERFYNFIDSQFVQFK